MLDSGTSQRFTAESALEAVGNVFAFPSLPESIVFDACNWAINVIDWTLSLRATKTGQRYLLRTQPRTEYLLQTDGL